MLRFLLLTTFVVNLLVFAASDPKTPTQVIPTPEEVNASQIALEQERKALVTRYKNDLGSIESDLSKESIWGKSYSSYLTFLSVIKELGSLEKRIEKLTKYGKSQEDKDTLEALLSKEKILRQQVDLLKGEGSSPFASLLQPEVIVERPTITNPIDIFSGYSFVKTLDAQYSDYKKRENELQSMVRLLNKKNQILLNLSAIDKSSDYSEQIERVKKKLDRFETALDTVKTTAAVYIKRIETIELEINKDISKQVYKLFYIGIIILVLFVVFFLLKQMVKKYITDNERFYMANKIITFVNFTLIILIILFNYIENASYIVTVLGFASAGIAIAMKDWFMSILGWLVIVFGGSIHVGDRIRVDMDGIKYVGDVMDISLLRITLLEDITLTSYYTNRRAGRIIFVPNNYVFTRMIANYSHDSLKTVWDGIDITITFESNHKKAMHLAKEVTRKYSKGYTDITRKQLNKLRHKYSLKNTNVEPRIYSFIEPNGLQISAWYLTNAYATLTLRSVISTEIIDAFNQEDDIQIAYPTQRLFMKEGDPQKVPPFKDEELNS